MSASHASCCAFCRSPTPHLVCPCYLVAYCKKDCQAAHWGEHKAACKVAREVSRAALSECAATAAAALRGVLSIAASADAQARVDEIASLLAGITPAGLGYGARELQALPPSSLSPRSIVFTPHCDIAVFEIGRGAAMTLHDHPGAVVSHVLSGSAQVVCFALSEENVDDDLNSLGAIVSARFAGSALIGAGESWVTHSTGNNIHAFRALEEPGSAILDVVLPPYKGCRHELARAELAARMARSSASDCLVTYYELVASAPPHADLDAFSLAGAPAGTPVLLRRKLPAAPPGSDCEACSAVAPSTKPPLAIQAAFSS